MSIQTKKFIVPIVIAASLTLSACGTKQDDAKEKKETTSASMQGAKEMKQTLKDLKEQLKAKKTDEVKEAGEQLEKSWESFEDGVKDKDAALYEKVETPLHTIEAGAKSAPLDVKTLTKAAEQLDAVLSDVEKLK
ncbi:hypothetical protein A374_10980 [Fictibacillus macauensis ZFHKF-1]|uniref:Lipoprotein n=1 Tax=Fictibacillus macauensis ZFHKF-1 TaxID=1196324 RepID=I8AHQ5_9BACL|nr:hypothetical protein [Fictibacillus macauensis]EIT85262.1 hypothetical protein A374_10980 [Fictibacillus macauensis ZFHKF-1]